MAIKSLKSRRSRTREPENHAPEEPKGAESEELEQEESEVENPERIGVVKKKRQRSHKKHMCKYCKSMKADLSCHLKRMHSTEDDVMEYISEKNKSKKRVLFNKIAGEGSKLLEIDPAFSPIKLRRDHRAAYGETRCVNCSFLVSNLGYVRHLKKCNPEKLNDGKDAQILNKALTLKDAPYASIALKKIILKMNRDKVTEFIKSDKVLCEMAERFLEKHSASDKKEKLCARSMRVIGRIFVEVQKIIRMDDSTQIISGDNFFQPQKFKYFEKALKTFANINEDGVYEKPSVLSQYGLIVKSMARFTASNFLKQPGMKNEAKAKDAAKWLKVFDAQFNYIAAGARGLHLKPALNCDLPNIKDKELSEEDDNEDEEAADNPTPVPERVSPAIPLTSGVISDKTTSKKRKAPSDDEYESYSEADEMISPRKSKKTIITRARIPEKILRLICAQFESFILEFTYPPIDAIRQGLEKLNKVMPNEPIFQRPPSKFRVIVNNEINKRKNKLAQRTPHKK